jgi:hypothetical protein
MRWLGTSLLMAMGSAVTAPGGVAAALSLLGDAAPADRREWLRSGEWTCDDDDCNAVGAARINLAHWLADRTILSRRGVLLARAA